MSDQKRDDGEVTGREVAAVAGVITVAAIAVSGPIGLMLGPVLSVLPLSYYAVWKKGRAEKKKNAA